MQIAKNQGLTDSFLVFVRVRPLPDKARQPLIQAKNNTLFVQDPYLGKAEASFAFDKVFDENSKNIQIFEQAVSPAIDNLVKGFNSTVLAYGTTGSGKTHSMFGRNEERGCVQLTASLLLERFKSIKLSYMQIYNQQVRDLMKGGSQNLGIIQDQIKGILVPGLTQVQITSETQLKAVIEEGNLLRVMAPTSNNQFSSRSHAIVQMTVGNGQKFSLVDLAGSQRAGEGPRGARHTQGCNINKSLLALGNCIMLLGQKRKKQVFIPYRDSKLTRLLKESLGGNAKTIMLACVSSCPMFYEDTINSLKYATRAKKIEKEVRTVKRDNEDQINSLKEEIARLRVKLGESPVERTDRDPFIIEKSVVRLMENIQEGSQIKQQIQQIFKLQQRLVEQFEQLGRGGQLEQANLIKHNINQNEADYSRLDHQYNQNLIQRKEIQFEIIHLGQDQQAKLRKEIQELRQANKGLQLVIVQKDVEIKKLKNIQPIEEKVEFRRSASLFRQDARNAPHFQQKRQIPNFSSVSTASSPLQLPPLLCRSVLEEKSNNLCVLQKKRTEYLKWKKKLLSLIPKCQELSESQIKEVDKQEGAIRTQQDNEIIKALYKCLQGDFGPIKLMQREKQELQQVKQFLSQFG